MAQPSGPAAEPNRAMLSQISDRMRLFLSVVEKCVQQLDDSQVWFRSDEGDNAIANLMLHLPASFGSGSSAEWEEKPRAPGIERRSSGLEAAFRKRRC